MKIIAFFLVVLITVPATAALPEAAVEKPASVAASRYAGFNVAVLVHIYMHLLMVPEEKETKPSLLEMMEEEIMRGVE